MTLIGIGHQKQVGKDTVAEMLKEYCTSKGKPCYIYHFADELYRECAELLGITVEEIKKNKVLGFVGKDTEKSDEEIDKAYTSMKTQLLLELKNTLRPELLNRIDDIVIFRSLTRKDARKIVKLLVKELNGRLAQEGVSVVLDNKAIASVVKEGFSEEYGARPIKRVLQDTVENAIANYLLEKGRIGNELKNMEIKIGMKDNKISVLNKK